jgi:hypothetical protein
MDGRDGREVLVSPQETNILLCAAIMSSPSWRGRIQAFRALNALL